MEDQTEAVAEARKNESTVKLCRRCKNPYYSASNTPCSCRFHPSFFVCRRHDDQKRYYELGPEDPPYAAKFYDCCGAEDPHAIGPKSWMRKVEGCVRYYELGPEDPPYAAKFYDCCGAEDPHAIGCTTDFHISYDDN